MQSLERLIWAAGCAPDHKSLCCKQPAPRSSSEPPVLNKRASLFLPACQTPPSRRATSGSAPRPQSTQPVQQRRPAMAAPTETTPLAAGSAELVQQRASVVMGFVGKLKENATNSFREAKPWTEVFDRTAFAKPSGVPEATGRLRKNVAYFKVNYGIVGVGTTALVMFMNPWSLIVLALLAVLWGYSYIVRTTPFVFSGRELSDREKFLALSGFSLVVIFFLTSVGSTLFYALGLSMLLVGAHAAFRVPDDLFLDEAPEQQSGGFLSLLTGGSKPVAAVVANAV